MKLPGPEMKICVSEQVEHGCWISELKALIPNDGQGVIERDVAASAAVAGQDGRDELQRRRCRIAGGHGKLHRAHDNPPVRASRRAAR